MRTNNFNKNNQICIASPYGFTLVEILVATVVFGLFLTSLFTLYRMGSNMFVAGTWKLEKQTDAERFFNVLKERMEQASSPLDVKKDGTIADGGASQFGVSTGTHSFDSSAVVTPLAKATRLLAFPIIKPAINENSGLILYNILRAVPHPIKATLMNLEYVSTTNIDSGIGNDFIGASTFSFFESSALDLKRFDGTSSQFGLGADPYSSTLKDLANITISIIPIPDDLAGTDSLIKIDVLFQHPTNPNTTLDHSMTTRVYIPLIKGAL